MLDISTAGMVSAPQWSALKTYRRELSEDISFSIVPPPSLGCRAIGLGKLPQGVCVTYTAVACGKPCGASERKNVGIGYPKQPELVGWGVCLKLRCEELAARRRARGIVILVPSCRTYCCKRFLEVFRLESQSSLLVGTILLV